MNLYNYTALDQENSVTEGVIEDLDKAAVARRLIMQGLRPLEINPHTRAGKPSFFVERFRISKVTRSDINFFTKQIALLLNAGLSLDVSLRVMKEQANKPAFRDFVGLIERDLKEGKSFSQALANHPKQFPPMYVNLVKAGEEGGILPAMLIKTSEYQSTFQDLRQFVVSASIYPIIVMLVGITAVIILLTAILPRFEVLFSGIDQQLPFHVKVMMDSAKFVTDHFIVSFFILVIPPIVLISYVRTKDGRKKMDHLALQIPLLSTFVRDLETTKIFRTLEVLVNNGVHLATALKISSGVAGNLEFRRMLNRATQALKEGQRVGKKIKGEGLLPGLAVDLLSIGEESGQVGHVCGQVADHYENELRTKIKRLLSIIEPVFIVIIAIVTGYVVISMLSVILSINEIAG